MNWFEVQITTTLEAEDAVAECFYEAGAGGVAIESAADINGLWGELTTEFIDENILNRKENVSIIKGYFPAETSSDQRIQEILLKIAQLPEYGLNPGSAELKIVEVKEEDWENTWKKFFMATKISPSVIVVPSWENYHNQDNEKIIKMDPGMAFGTGMHETTRLCANLLEKYLNENDNVADIGTGSGILAMTAALLGAGEVLATEIDPSVIKVAKENIRNNNLEKKIKVIEANLLNEVHLNNPDIITANILPEPLKNLTPQIKEKLKSGGIVIYSGLLKEHVPEIITVLEENTFRILETTNLGEWSAIVAERL